MVNQEIKKRVLNYVIEHPGAEDTEIAEKLNLHIIDVVAALVMLEEEGLVRVLK